MVNNTWNKAINATPSKALLGYDQRALVDFKLCELIERMTKIAEDYEKERDEV